ncbi:hypothetical protein GGU45_000151 [Niabella hirudinis]
MAMQKCENAKKSEYGFGKKFSPFTFHHCLFTPTSHYQHLTKKHLTKKHFTKKHFTKSISPSTSH